jgi:hypothetical protein
MGLAEDRDRDDMEGRWAVDRILAEGEEAAKKKSKS